MFYRGLKNSIGKFVQKEAQNVAKTQAKYSSLKGKSLFTTVQNNYVNMRKESILQKTELNFFDKIFTKSKCNKYGLGSSEDLQKFLNEQKLVLSFISSTKNNLASIKKIEKQIDSKYMEYSILYHPLVNGSIKMGMYSTIGCVANLGDIIDAKENLGTGAMFEEIAKKSIMYAVCGKILGKSFACIKLFANSLSAYCAKGGCWVRLLSIPMISLGVAGGKKLIDSYWKTSYEISKQ